MKFQHLKALIGVSLKHADRRMSDMDLQQILRDKHTCTLHVSQTGL